MENENDIAYRALEIIREVTGTNRRTKELEEETGISSSNWKNVWNKKQKPTIHMIEAISRRWPQFAFWLATGITDEENGHIAPKLSPAHNEYETNHKIETDAEEYFNFKLFFQNVLNSENINSHEFHIYNAQNKKLTELECAIKKIAFNKRQKELSKHYFGEENFLIEWVEYLNRIRKIQMERKK